MFVRMEGKICGFLYLELTEGSRLFRMARLILSSTILCSFPVKAEDKHELELDFKRYWEEFWFIQLGKGSCLFTYTSATLLCTIVPALLEQKPFINGFFVYGRL
jgi:hypothetical protein